MAGLLVELLPFALALALTPTAIAAGILFLSSVRPVPNDLAFTAPFVAVYGLLAGIVLVASGASSGPLLDDHDKGVAALAVGAVLLVLALASVVRRRRTAMPRKKGLVERIASATPGEAFEIGTVVAVLNPTSSRAWPGCDPMTPPRAVVGGP